MEDGNNVSNASVEVGSFDGQNTPGVTVSLVVNEQKANEQLERLNNLSGGNVNTEFCAVVEVKVNKGQEEKVKELLDHYLSDEKCQDVMFRGPRRDIVRGNIGYKSHAAHQCVLLSFSPPEQVVQMAQGQLGNLPGLNALAKEQVNRVTAQASLGNTFDQVLELNGKGTNVFNALLQLMKASVQVSLNPQFTTKLGEALSPMLEPMGIPVGLFVQLSLLYKSFDLALQFSSGKQLPDNIRKLLMREMDIVKTPPKEVMAKEGGFCDVMRNALKPQGVDVTVVVPGLAHAHASVQAQGLSSFLANTWFKK